MPGFVADIALPAWTIFNVMAVATIVTDDSFGSKIGAVLKCMTHGETNRTHGHRTISYQMVFALAAVTRRDNTAFAGNVTFQITFIAERLRAVGRTVTFLEARRANSIWTIFDVVITPTFVTNYAFRGEVRTVLKSMTDGCANTAAGHTAVYSSMRRTFALNAKLTRMYFTFFGEVACRFTLGAIRIGAII